MFKLNSPIIFGIVAIITSILYFYLHIRHASWVYEDITWLWARINSNYTFTGNWRTLMDSFPSKDLALFTFSQGDPRVVHLWNLVIHIVNAILLALFIEEILNCGWIIGSLFLINPLTIQAVAYGAGRAELLSLTALLIFLWFAIVSFANDNFRWFGIVLSILMMLTTKPTIIIIAPFLLMLLYYYGYNYNWLDGLGWKLFSFCLLGLLFVAPNVMAQVHSTISKWDWFRIQSVAAWRLMASGITGLNLSIDHAWWLAPMWLSIVTVICIIVTGIVVVIRKSSSTFGLGFFWIAIIPRLLTPNYLGWIREHHMYVPAVGICIMMSSLFTDKELSNV